MSGLEPLAAFGMAANICQFIEYGFKIVAEAKRLRESGSLDPELERDTRRMKDLASTLRDTPLPSGTSSDAAALKAIAADCISLTDDLIDMTDSLKIGQSKSKVESLKAAVRNRRRKEKREEVEKKLERCKGQLNLQITSMSRYVESCRFSRRWNFYYHYASGWDVIAE